jgi:SEC-C motif-containing protein
VDYIVSTMQGPAAKDFDKLATQGWLTNVKWISLVVNSHKIKTPTLGYVIFEARYHAEGKLHVMREKSEFHKINEKWYYVTGKPLNPHYTA